MFTLPGKLKFDTNAQENAALAEAWIKHVTQGDEDLGRTADNLMANPLKTLTKAKIEAMHAIGVVMAVCGGNYFEVKVNGRQPIIRQVRALASRRVVL